jgi:hypothetical protein
MSSTEFTADSEEKRPTVQVGDPFAEKLLIEATLELMATGAVAAIQDMGAAGLTSSSVEMAGKGGVGIELNMDMVPQREEGMSAYEMMLSESQERMLAVLKPGREQEGHAIFEKWGLDAAIIGYTTDTGRLVLKHHGETVCDVPLAPLFDDAPLYDRPWVQPALQPRLDPGQDPRPDRLERSGPEDRRLPRHGLQALAVGAVRPPRDGRHPGRQRHRLRRRHRAHPRHGQGHRRDQRLHPALRPGRPLRGRQAGRGRSLAQPDGRRLAADRHHRQPELRQPRKARDHGPDRPRHRRHGRGLPRARLPGRERECVSLYNETNGVAIPPTPTVGAVGLLATTTCAPASARWPRATRWC